MNRTLALKLGYLLAFACLAGVATWLVVRTHSAVTAAVIALVLLVPGRITGHYYRQFFRARHLLDGGKPGEALPLLQQFLADVRARPRLKPLLWLTWSVYTPDVEAMTLNNIGAAQLELGAVALARSALEAALDLDGRYPIPHYNLAVIHELDGNRIAAQESAATAIRLGFTGGRVDRVVVHAQSLLARIEGRTSIVRTDAR